MDQDSVSLETNASREITQTFTVMGPTAAIKVPQDGGSIGIASQNDRGFIDVTIGLPASQTLDLASVYDLDPEFTIDAPAGGADFDLVLDETQAPVLVSQQGSSYTFRYWTIGSYTTAMSRSPLSPTSFTAEDGTDGQPNIAYSTNIADPGTANIGYLDVNYQPTSGFELDLDSIDGDEFTLAGTAITASLALSGTYEPLRLTNSNTFRYFLEGDFGAGTVTVEFGLNSFQSVAVDEPGIDAGGIGNRAEIPSIHGAGTHRRSGRPAGWRHHRQRSAEQPRIHRC